MHRDEKLLAAIAKRDHMAFSQLMDRHLANVRALIWRMTGDHALCDDLAQDVFLKLWRRPQSYNPDKAKFTTWLYQVTSNTCLDALRKHARQRQTPLSDDLPGNNASPQAELEQAQQAARVTAALTSLPERQRLALTLSHFQGMSNTETAQIMDTSIEAVESLLARARRSLKKKLRDEIVQLTGRDIT